MAGYGYGRPYGWREKQPLPWQDKKHVSWGGDEAFDLNIKPAKGKDRKG